MHDCNGATTEADLQNSAGRFRTLFPHDKGAGIVTIRQISNDVTE